MEECGKRDGRIREAVCKNVRSEMPEFERVREAPVIMNVRSGIEKGGQRDERVEEAR